MIETQKTIKKGGETMTIKTKREYSLILTEKELSVIKESLELYNAVANSGKKDVKDLREVQVTSTFNAEVANKLVEQMENNNKEVLPL